jgi:hypothetical protein
MSNPRARASLNVIGAAVLSLLAGRPLAAADADFAGTWTLGAVFGDFGTPQPRSRRTNVLVIRETATEIIVERSGEAPVAYRKDGTELLSNATVTDATSEPRQKVRTQLIRVGPALVTHTTPVREEVDTRSGATTLVAGATRVEAYTLSADRNYLAVVRTARRSRTPEMPQDRLDDGDASALRPTDVFVKSSN